MSRIIIRHLLIILTVCFIPVKVKAQVVQPVYTQDSLVLADSLLYITDTIALDSLVLDSLALNGQGSKKPLLEAEVTYTSEDSLSISLGQERVYLYDKATVNYQDIGLKADYIEFDYSSKTVMATGVIDSAGQLAGKPEFTQGEEMFNSDTMRYNFQTRKGIIKYIITQQGEGFLHSTRTKRLEDGEIHISKGKYTTCEAVHPHFYIALTKAIAIPNKKIVSGPAYMVFEDIPLPLALPFGFFPNTTKRSAGLIMPDFRDEQTRGFGLEKGGWYFPLNDYLDISLLGTLYSRGSWGVYLNLKYIVNYKYSGQFKSSFFNTLINDDPTANHTKDFSITWSHSQDSKANPTRKFSASVNFSSTAYDKNQSTNINDLLTNQKNSSISFTKDWTNFNFSANLNGSQNSKTHLVNLTLPTMSLDMSRIFPFRGKKSEGKFSWFENIQVTYNAELKNTIKATDTTLFTQNTLNNMENGFEHSIPISLPNIKVLKYFNVTPGISYNGVLYSKYIQKRVLFDTLLYSSTIVTDTIQKITYAHSISPSLGISVSPKIYGMFVSTRPNSYIASVRHVMTPSASFSFSPDMSGIMPNYYRKIAYPGSVTQEVQYTEYSAYEGQPYGTPTVNGRSGSVSLSLNNNLEMKVRSKNDTTADGKKVSILDNLNFSTSYSPFATSFRWSAVNMKASTKLFNKNLDIQFSSTFNPYALDSSGKTKIDKFLINEKGKLFRTTKANIGLGFSLKSAAGDDKKSSTGSSEGSRADETNPTLDMMDESSGSYESDYVNYDIPWSISVDYSWSFSKEASTASYTHTLRLDGDISLTSKWKIGMNTGYDFVAKEITTTNLSINRDLHCWQMRISVVPFGDRKSYSFTISAKSSILSDLKWDKQKSWYDNF